MKRRQMLKTSAGLGLMAALPAAIPPFASGTQPVGAPPANPNALMPPAQGSIPVAFVVAEGAVLIDFAGPWEVFREVSVPGRRASAFRLYTVSDTTEPIVASGGMKIVPDHTFETAPAPKIVVIPALQEPSEAMLEWIRNVTRSTDLTMSVCTGAFVLASTGLLSGKAATTHHAAYQSLAMSFPDIEVKRGARFVEAGNLATSGGLSSGIDLALRVVERYYGREVAKATAYQMEYQGQGWMNADSNSEYGKVRVSTAEHPLCPVCEMDVDPKDPATPTTVFKGRTYYLCSSHCKEQFATQPDKYASAFKAL
jgi:transcriptional regulator GlxA family with amidase domain